MSMWCTVSEFSEICSIRRKPVKSKKTVIRQIKEAENKPEIFPYKTRKNYFGKAKFFFEIELKNDVNILLLERLRMLEKEGKQLKGKAGNYIPVKCKAIQEEKLILKNSDFRKGLLLYIMQNEEAIQRTHEPEQFILQLPNNEYRVLSSMAKSKKMTISDVLIWYLRLYLNTLEGKTLFAASIGMPSGQSDQAEPSDSDVICLPEKGIG